MKKHEERVKNIQNGYPVLNTLFSALSNAVHASGKCVTLAIDSGTASSIILGGGGRIFIPSCSALLISFEIDCFYGL
jgi:hypothetical protein